MTNWISVDDSLPTPETDVLVRGVVGGDYVKYTVAGLWEGEWASCETEENTSFRVTHWQPFDTLEI